MLEHQLRLNAITQPVLSLEQRMGALAAPFDDAAYKLVEIATNLFKLNQTSVRELTAATGQVSAVVECLRIDRKSARRNKRFGRTVAIPFDEQTWGAGGQPITISKIHADGPVEEADAANGKL